MVPPLVFRVTVYTAGTHLAQYTVLNGPLSTISVTGEPESSSLSYQPAKVYPGFVT